MKKPIYIWEILGSLWIIYIFLGSLPYKFSGHEYTQYIFWTIGEWMAWYLWNTVWLWFWLFGAYLIWFLELIISLILISALYFIARQNIKMAACAFKIAWLWAMILMLWAVFFHLFTPLGISVNDDGWSLFRAAVSIVFIGAFLVLFNWKSILDT